MFSTDATWQANKPVDLCWKGLQEIIIAMPASVERMEFLFQQSSSVVINSIDDEHARAMSYMTELGKRSDDGSQINAIGSWDDELIKEQGTWKFHKRTFTLRYFEIKPATGEAVSKYSY